MRACQVGCFWSILRLSNLRTVRLEEDVMDQLTQIHTAADLWALPDAGRRYELVRGELREMSPTGIEHSHIVAKLTWRLMEYVTAHNLGLIVTGEPGFWIATSPDTVRAPDVAF